MRNYHIILISLLIIGAYRPVGAQCLHYDRLMREADANTKSKHYDVAIAKYQAAMTDCDDVDRKKKAYEKLEGLVRYLNQSNQKGDKDSLDYERKIGEQIAKNDSLKAIVGTQSDSITLVLREASRADSLRRRTERIYSGLVDSLVLTGREITLASKTVDGDLEYFYIDVSGAKITQLGTWKRAMQFQSDGLAHVQDERGSFTIDTKGNQWPKSLDGYDKADRSVDCSHENLSKLPSKICDARELNILIANGNELERIPRRIKNLSQLYFVNFSDNVLKRVKRLRHNRILMKIGAQGNDLGMIPRSFGHLDSLVSLDLSRNHIKRIPNSLFKLQNIKELKLEYNRLPKVGRKIAQLASLEVLEMSFNQLQCLPAEIGNLHKLKYLGITGNQISLLDDVNFYGIIGQLSSLKVLRLGCNLCSDTVEERAFIRQRVLEILPNCLVVFN